MRIPYTFLILSFLFVFSCGGSHDETQAKAGRGGSGQNSPLVGNTPEEYNNYIVSLQDTVMRGFMKLASAMANEDHARMDAEYQNLRHSLEYSKKEIEKLGDFNGDTDLREKGKALFRVYESVLENEYKRMVEIVKKGDRITEEEKAELSTVRNRIAEKEMEMDSKFQRTQTEFARKNQMIMQQHPQQHSVDSMVIHETPVNRRPNP